MQIALETPNNKCAAPLQRIAALAAAEVALNAELAAIQTRISGMQLKFAKARSFGCFIVTNFGQVAADFEAEQQRLHACYVSPHIAAAASSCQVAEQLLQWVRGIMDDACWCQQLYLTCSQVLQAPLATQAEPTPELKQVRARVGQGRLEK